MPLLPLGHTELEAKSLRMKYPEEVESADFHLEVLVEALVQLQDCRHIAAPADMHAQASASGTIYPCGVCNKHVPTV